MGLSTMEELRQHDQIGDGFERFDQTDNGFEWRDLIGDGFGWIGGWTTIALSLSLYSFLFSVCKILFEGNLYV